VVRGAFFKVRASNEDASPAMIKLVKVMAWWLAFKGLESRRRRVEAGEKGIGWRREGGGATPCLIPTHWSSGLWTAAMPPLGDYYLSYLGTHLQYQRSP
jgi:hypothetical protein